MSFITNPAPLRSFVKSTRTRRSDFLLLSDSNTIFGGHGQDHGITRALSLKTSLYRTGLASANENLGLGSQSGYFYGTANNGARQYTSPITLIPGYDNILPAGSPGALFPAKYWHQTDAQTDGSNQGITISTGGPWNVNARIRGHWTWHTFDTAGSGIIRPAIRRDSSPFTSLAQAPANIDPVTGAQTTVDYTLEIAAGTRDYPIGVRWIGAGTTGSGPFFLTWISAEWPDILTGTSINVIGFYGGVGLRLFWTYEQAPQATWNEYFRQLQKLQGQTPRACLIITSGLNDRNDNANNSIGPIGGLNSSTKAGYADNALGLINYFDSKWSTAGLPISNLTYLLLCSHPTGAPDDSQLRQYREANAEIARSNARVTAYDMSEFNSQLQANSATWYAGAGGTDKNHMTQTGYEQFYELVFGKLWEEGLKFVAADKFRRVRRAA